MDLPGGHHGKYRDDKVSDSHYCSVDDLMDIEKEEIDCAIALPLSNEDQKGKNVIEDDSQSKDDEQLCEIDEEEDEYAGKVHQEEDDHVDKIQQHKDEHLDVQLEEDEQLAGAIQESLSIGSPPGSNTDSLFQPFPDRFPPIYRFCAGCNAEIGHGTFMMCKRAIWHPECFRCHACNLPITDYKFPMYGYRCYHESCFYNEMHHPRCDVCDIFIPPNSIGLIEYRGHPFWLQKYCPSHEHDGTPRCCSCKRMKSRDTKYLLLDDDRKLCLECLDSAIMDTNECQPLYVEIQEFFEGLNMKIEQQVPMLLVERQALNEAMEGEKNDHHHLYEIRGLCLSEEQIVPTILRRPKIGARYQIIDMITEPYRLIHYCEVTAILVLYGLPRSLTGATLAHEMMHAWLRLKGYDNLIPEVEEGICQVLSHMWLESEIYSGSGKDGASSSSSSSSSFSTFSTSSNKGKRPDFERKLCEFAKLQIESDSSPTYGDGFRQGNQAVLKYGLKRTLDHIRMTGNFPK